VEVDEVTLDNSYRRIFTGWMFASSPGLSGIEHPVYDVWLVECKGGTEVIAEPRDAFDEPPPGQPQRRQAERNPAERSPAATAQAGVPGVAPPPAARIDVAPPRGVPTVPAQQPSRRFFPTTGAQGQAPMINTDR
jgi:hypothetical protein